MRSPSQDPTAAASGLCTGSSPSPSRKSLPAPVPRLPSPLGSMTKSQLVIGGKDLFPGNLSQGHSPNEGKRYKQEDVQCSVVYNNDDDDDLHGHVSHRNMQSQGRLSHVVLPLNGSLHSHTV